MGRRFESCPGSQAFGSEALLGVPVDMSMDQVEIQERGKAVKAQSLTISGMNVITRGRWVKIASIMDEELVDPATTTLQPEVCASAIRRGGMAADIFTFGQKLPYVEPKYNYHLEWDNAAAIRITSFADWEKRVEHDVRKALKRAKRLGVVVKVAEFSDALAHGIKNIYDESPVRQGKAFWHYGKDLDAVKRENSTYLDRSTFIGAYYQDELIGFIRMVRVGTVESTLQVISQQKHFDKKPTNAMIAKAVEVCEERGASHLVYGHYMYNGLHSSLTEFKRRNGFEQVLLPRYYIPLTAWGQIAMMLGLHRPLVSRIPTPVLSRLRRIKSSWYSRQVHAAPASS